MGSYLESVNTVNDYVDETRSHGIRHFGAGEDEFTGDIFNPDFQHCHDSHHDIIQPQNPCFPTITKPRPNEPRMNSQSSPSSTSSTSAGGKRRREQETPSIDSVLYSDVEGQQCIDTHYLVHMGGWDCPDQPLSAFTSPLLNPTAFTQRGTPPQIISPPLAKSLPRLGKRIKQECSQAPSAPSTNPLPKIENKVKQEASNAASALSKKSLSKPEGRVKEESPDIPDSGKQISLACPFYKKNPQAHHSCLKYRLRRIKDVKQHIYRQHKQPDFYCPRCFQIFNTSEERDRHIRDIQCSCKDGPQFNGISDREHKQLTEKFSRRQPTDVQWFEIWDIVFPGQTKPSTCYLGNYAEELVSQLRDFWDDNKSAMLKSVVDDNADNINRCDLDKLIGVMLDRFEVKISNPDVGKHEKEPPPKPSSPEPQPKPTTKMDAGTRADDTDSPGETIQGDSQQLYTPSVETPEDSFIDWLLKNDGGSAEFSFLEEPNCLLMAETQP